MRNKSAAIALVIVGLQASALPARSEGIGGNSFYQAAAGPWEFGLDFGMAYPAQKASFRHVIDNQRAYDLLADESVGDEVAEGFVAPPLPGFSAIAATLKSSPDFSLHAYRNWTPWLALGIEGGWVIKRDSQIDDSGIYQPTNFLVLHYNASIIHLNLPVRLGPQYKGFRAYVTGGPGVYDVQERATISFNDADDPQLTPLEIVRRDRVHFGVSGGAGLEQRVGDRGLIGFEIQYHKLFASRDRVDFVLPRLRFSVAF